KAREAIALVAIGADGRAGWLSARPAGVTVDPMTLRGSKPRRPRLPETKPLPGRGTCLWHSRVMAANETATLGGGCFWCLEAVYEEMRGVSSVESGYMGGHVVNPDYRSV